MSRSSHERLSAQDNSFLLLESLRRFVTEAEGARREIRLRAPRAEEGRK